VARRHGTTTSVRVSDPLADKVIVLRWGSTPFIISSDHTASPSFVSRRHYHAARDLGSAVFRASPRRARASQYPPAGLRSGRPSQDLGIGFCASCRSRHHGLRFVTIWIAVASRCTAGWQYYHVGKRVVASASEIVAVGPSCCSDRSRHNSQWLGEQLAADGIGVALPISSGRQSDRSAPLSHRAPREVTH